MASGSRAFSENVEGGRIVDDERFEKHSAVPNQGCTSEHEVLRDSYWKSIRVVNYMFKSLIMLGMDATSNCPLKSCAIWTPRSSHL